MLSVNAVQNADSRILETLAGLAGHHGRTWCYPSQEKLLELLKRFTGRTMSRRHLCRHLKALERDGYLRRIRRHKRARNGSLWLRSTCYVLGGRWLCRAARLVKAVLKQRAGPKAPEALPAVTAPAQNAQGYRNLSLRERRA